MSIDRRFVRMLLKQAYSPSAAIDRDNAFKPAKRGTRARKRALLGASPFIRIGELAALPIWNLRGNEI